MLSDKKTILLIGLVACFGAFMGVLADLFSAWSASPNAMDTAVSVSIDSIKGLYLDKPRWTYVLGNYLGVFFLPFHMLGFVLVYRAITPAGGKQAILFTAGAFYFVAVGTGFHGTLAFIGDTIQSGDAALLGKMSQYWSHWGLALVAGYLVMTGYLFLLMLSGRTRYPRWTALLSPMPVMLLSTIIVAALPGQMYGARAFLAVTGLNLPLLIQYVVTVIVLLGNTVQADRTGRHD